MSQLLTCFAVLAAEDADVPQACAVARRHASCHSRNQPVPTERQVGSPFPLYLTVYERLWIITVIYFFVCFVYFCVALTKRCICWKMHGCVVFLFCFHGWICDWVKRCCRSRVLTACCCLFSRCSRRAVTEHQLMHDRGRNIQSLKRLFWLSSAIEGLHTAQTRSAAFNPTKVLSLALKPGLIPDAGSSQNAQVRSLLRDFFNPYLPNGDD